MPDRSARRRRRAARAEAADRAGPRDRRRGGGHRTRCRLVPRGRARRHPLARLHLRQVPLLHRGPGEPVRRGAVHRLSDRWRLRRIRRGRRPLLLSDPWVVRRPRGGAVAVRGADRLSLAAHGRRGRAARDLRLRRRRPHRRSGRTAPGPAGVRLHAGGRRCGAGVRARAGRGVDRQLGGAAARRAGRRDRLRARWAR